MLLHHFLYTLHRLLSLFTDLPILLLFKAIDPCADGINDLFGFWTEKFGFPGRYIGELVYPDRDFGCVVGGFDVPFMRKTGGGAVYIRFRCGTCQVWRRLSEWHESHMSEGYYL